MQTTDSRWAGLHLQNTFKLENDDRKCIISTAFYSQSPTHNAPKSGFRWFPTVNPRSPHPSLEPHPSAVRRAGSGRLGPKAREQKGREGPRSFCGELRVRQLVRVR